MSLQEIITTLPKNVTLIAVSKTQPIEAIEQLIKSGHKVFGENKIQEAEEKFTLLKEKYPDIELHFIGHLQSNKAKQVVKLCDYIHSIDSKKLAEELASEMQKQNRNIPCFIQVNTGNEEQKGGVLIEELQDLYNYCTKDLKLNILGLMCIPPLNDLPDAHFALLHKTANKLGLKNLSMGMSSDYKRALIYGATHIRIGTAIFGERNYAE